MIGYNFGMHHAGVLLDILMFVLVLLLAIWAIGVNRSYLSTRCERGQHECAGDYGCNVFSHLRLVVGQAPRLPTGKDGNRSGCPTNSTRLRLLLGAERRSVSEKAPLQNQFSERKCAGWSGVE